MKKLILLFFTFGLLIVSGQSPVAKFSISSESITPTESKVKFTNASEGNPTSLSWDFPGGNPVSSTAANPGVTYSVPGVYTAKLTVTNSFGISTVTFSFSVSEGEQVMYLCTGRNNDGTLIPNNPRTEDPEWWYVAPNGASYHPVTRAPRGGWSDAYLGYGPEPNSRWLAAEEPVGLHTYTQSFSLPADGTLDMKALGNNKNWVYLVKKNDNGTQTETLIAETEHRSQSPDTWQGYLNSWNPTILDYPVSAGNYDLKVVIETISPELFGGINVNANIKYQDGASVFNPVAGFIGLNKACLGKPVKFTGNAEGGPVSYSWKFQNSSDVFTEIGEEPEITFTEIGTYNAELTVVYTNGQSSTLYIENYIEIVDCDFSRAPNSYIFDINREEYGGLYIPIGKPYAMWGQNEYLEEKPISSTGTLSASMYWEDVSGLIKSVEIEQDSLVELSKIKVMINKLRGKGNAVIALHKGSNGNYTDPVLWSWHVWVTDDPSDGVQYGHPGDPELDIENMGFTPKFMDRNLGATHNTFLGDGWGKSGGLLYQWGRKDPFPPLMYLDATYYDISGSFNGNEAPLTYIHEYTRHKKRPYNSINDNIAYSIQNPYMYIDPQRVSGDGGWHWFSSQKIKGTDANGNVNFDLWGDATEGKFIPGAQSSTYKLKSPFDPCPNGWRVPSYRNQMDRVHYNSPWGHHRQTQDFGDNLDVIDIDYNPINSTDLNNAYRGIKIYPGLGYDFSNLPYSQRNIGLFPLAGTYYDYWAINGQDKIIYQDNNNASHLWGASINGDGQGSFFQSYIDGYEKMHVNSWSMTYTHAGNSVRCMQDPNMRNLEGLPVNKIRNFPTEYVLAEINRDFKEGLDNPNTYLIKANQTEVEIPANKAYAVYNQYLSEYGWPEGNLSVNVYWTTNQQLIQSVSLNGEGENAKIQVELNSGQKGNAVVSLHQGTNGNSDDKVLWSWQIWVPNGDPETNTITYRTESPIEGWGEHMINPTRTGLAPLSTIFMDRNLGAVEIFPSDVIDTTVNPTQDQITQAKLSGGLHYQWGRKDPIPTFLESTSIYVGSNITGIIIYTPVNSSTYDSNYTKTYLDYSIIAGVPDSDKKNEKISKVLKYSTNYPLYYMYNNAGVNHAGQPSIDWISNERGWAPDRWGHGTKKSPFDPCPSGWRVPDTYYVQGFNDRPGINQTMYMDKGNSPWHNGDVLITSTGYYGTRQGSYGPLSSNYNGKVAGGELGFYFNRKDSNGSGGYKNDEYRIGSYYFSGIRGWNYHDYIRPNKIELPYNAKDGLEKIFGLWSSSMTTHDATTGEGVYLLGRPLMVHGYFNYPYESGKSPGFSSGRIDDSKPQYAMNVRCAKDEPRYTGAPSVPSYFPESLAVQSKIAMNQVVEESVISESQIQIYPNPNTGLFKVMLRNIPEGILKIININGAVVFSQTFKGNTELDINIQNQPTGVYIINIQTDQGTVTKKMIKK